MKITIHIGAPRTGTTSLQDLCAKNIKGLAKQGISYPLIGLIHPKKGDAQHNLVFTLMDEYPAFVGKLGRMTRDQAWNELDTYIDNEPTRNHIFLSSEAFSGLSPESVKYIRDRLKDHEVSVIYIKRDSEDWRRSMAEQQIKRFPFKTEPMQATENSKDVSIKHLAGWQEYFTVDVVPYSSETSQVILEKIGVDCSNFKPIERKNRKVSPKVYELMMRFNKVEMSIEQHSTINQIAYSFFDSPEFSSKPVELLAKSLEENKKVTATHQKEIRERDAQISKLEEQYQLRDAEVEKHILTLQKANDTTLLAFGEKIDKLTAKLTLQKNQLQQNDDNQKQQIADLIATHKKAAGKYNARDGQNKTRIADMKKMAKNSSQKTHAQVTAMKLAHDKEIANYQVQDTLRNSKIASLSEQLEKKTNHSVFQTEKIDKLTQELESVHSSRLWQMCQRFSNTKSTAE